MKPPTEQKQLSNNYWKITPTPSDNWKTSSITKAPLNYSTWTESPPKPTEKWRFQHNAETKTLPPTVAKRKIKMRARENNRHIWRPRPLLQEAFAKRPSTTPSAITYEKKLQHVWRIAKLISSKIMIDTEAPQLIDKLPHLRLYDVSILLDHMLHERAWPLHCTGFDVVSVTSTPAPQSQTDTQAAQKKKSNCVCVEERERNSRGTGPHATKQTYPSMAMKS